MNVKDQNKVLKAGFAIIRKRQVKNVPVIKIKTHTNPKWRILENGFNSKTERDKKMKELLATSHIIED